MEEQKLTYEQFKADILQWKNSHREEYNRFASQMTNGDETQYLAICTAVFRQLPEIKREWELTWGDDSVETFENIDLLFKEKSVPKQIMELYRKQREENNPLPDIPPASFWERMKSVFNGKPQPSITISAPLVLSWLYYGKSFEAMVSKINELANNPKADKVDKLGCSFAVKQIISGSIKAGFRTQTDWEKYFSMNDAIKKGNIGEWALQSVANEMEADNDCCHITNDENADADVKSQRTAGKKKIQEQPLADYFVCNNKEAVLQQIRSFISINTSAVHQALPFYVLKDLKLVAGMHTAKEYSVGMTLQFTDLPSLKSESAIRQAVGFLKTSRHVIKNGKDQMAPLIESDDNQELFQSLVQEIKNIIASNEEKNGAE